MLEIITSVNTALNNFIWGVPAMVCIIGVGVEQFGETGDAFDPARHIAVMHIEDENLPESSVAEVLQKGYVYKDGQVVRHAAVKVAN